MLSGLAPIAVLDGLLASALLDAPTDLFAHHLHATKLAGQSGIVLLTLCQPPSSIYPRLTKATRNHMNA